MRQEPTLKTIISFLNGKEMQGSLVIRNFLVLKRFSWEAFNNNLRSNEKLRRKIFDAWPIRILGQVAVLATTHMNAPLGEQENKQRKQCSKSKTITAATCERCHDTWFRMRSNGPMPFCERY